MEATKALNDDFYLPNRAQLMLSFPQKHGDRIVQETPGPKKRFPNTVQLVQHTFAEILSRSPVVQSKLVSSRKRGVCVYTLILS